MAFVRRVIKRLTYLLTFYVFTWLKVGGPSIAAAHEGQKVGGPRPPGPIDSAAYARGGGSPDEARLEQTHTYSNPTNLALFRHKITLYRFNQGGSYREETHRCC